MSERHEEAPCFPMQYLGSVSSRRFDPVDVGVVTLGGRIKLLKEVVDKPTILSFFTTW